jgi:hypothetical protein
VGSRQKREQLRVFLDLQRKSKGTFYSMQSRWITMPAELAVERGYTKNAVFLHAEEAHKTLAGLAKDEACEQVSSPLVTALNGGRAELSVSRQLAYIAGYGEVYVEGPTPQLIIDPVVKVVSDGLWINLRARRSAEEHVALQVEATCQRVAQPFEVIEGKVGANGYGAYTRPEVLKTSIKTSLILKHGSTVILPAMLLGGKASVVLISVQMLNLKEGVKRLSLDGMGQGGEADTKVPKPDSSER